MYDGLIGRLHSGRWEQISPAAQMVIAEAAVAITELSKRVDTEYQSGFADGQRAANRKKNRWIPIQGRPMTAEERKEFHERTGYEPDDDEAVIYTSPLPKDGQEVLVSYTYRDGVGIDWFSNDSEYGCFFVENGEMDGISAWMPLPEAYKEDTQ